MTGALSALSATGASAADPRASLRKAAEAFEAVFARQMIGSMRTASLGDDILGNGASDQFRDMSDAKLAENMASSGALGIAEMLLKQFEGRMPAAAPTGDAA